MSAIIYWLQRQLRVLNWRSQIYLIYGHENLKASFGLSLTNNFCVIHHKAMLWGGSVWGMASRRDGRETFELCLWSFYFILVFALKGCPHICRNLVVHSKDESLSHVSVNVHFGELMKLIGWPLHGVDVGPTYDIIAPMIMSNFVGYCVRCAGAEIL